MIDSVRTITASAAAGLLALTLCLVATPAWALDEATVRLAGRVTDADGRPVDGATVTLHAAGLGVQQRTRTDRDGRFALADIAAGRYLVEATLNGSQRSAAQAVQLDAGTAPSSIELQLDHAAREEQIVVTAGDRPQRIDEVGKAITVVTLAEIERRQVSALPDLLRTIPGVQVTNNGGPGQLTQIRIRGLRADASAILVDGLRFRDASSTQGDATDLLANLTLVDPDRVEVLRGSASSLYGTNATGGAVNVVSRLGSAPTEGTLSVEAGQLGLSRVHGTINGALGGETTGAGPAGRVRYSVGLSRLDVRDGVDGDDEARNTDGQGTLVVQLSPATALTGRIWAGRSGADLNGSPSADLVPVANIPASGVVEGRALAPEQVRRLLAGQAVDYGDATFVPNLDNPDYRRRAQLFTGSVVLTHHLSDRASLRGTYQRVRTSRTFEDGPRGPGFQPAADSLSEYDGTIDSADVRASVELRRDLLLTGGYEFEREGYGEHQDNHAPDPMRVDVTTRIRQRAQALFGQASWQGLEDRLHVAAAVRAQRFHLSHPDFQFRGTTQNYDRAVLEDLPSAVTGDAAISYALPSSGTRLRLHVGNAYRAPALYERFGGGFSANPSSGQVDFSPYGDPRLEPDRYRSVDAGVDQSLAGERVRLHATWFHTDIDQLTAFDFSGGIDPSTDPYGRFVGYLNSDGGRSRGIELGGQLRPSSGLSVSASYTFADSVTDRDVAVPGIFRAMGIARHTLSVIATQQVGARLVLHGTLLATSDRYGTLFDAAFNPRAFAYPGFATVNLGASYTLPLAAGRSLRLFGKVDNLLDRDYYDLGWRAAGATFLGGVSFSFGGA